MFRNFLLFLLSALAWTGYAQINSTGPGNCLRFDGVNDYVDLGDIFDDVQLPVTISVWLYLETTASGSLPIFDSQDNNHNYAGFTMIVSNTPHIGITYGDGFGGNNPAFRASKAGIFNVMQGRWIHAAGVLRGPGDMTVYLNGQDIGGSYEGHSTNPMHSFSPGEVAKIGKWFSNGNTFWFKGLMDELRIYDRALGAAEIRETMCKKLTGAENGLIGYWRFDEASDSQIVDSSPKGYNGILKGDPQRVISGAPIGDVSVYEYGFMPDVSLTLDELSVTNMNTSPYGVHIYRVDDAPSQTSGLENVQVIEPYYGVFIAHDNEDLTFDVKSEKMTCTSFIRKDNAATMWSENTNFTFAKERIEIIFGDGVMAGDPLPDVLALCDATSTVLSAGVRSSDAAILWSTGEATPEIQVTESGKYRVEVLSECGIQKDSVLVSFEYSILPFSLGDDKMICDGEMIHLAPFGDDSTYEFMWHDGSTKPFLDVTEPGAYNVTVKNSCGEQSAEVIIRRFVFELDDLPNVITPNGDNKNDEFVFPVERGSMQLKVFNRWGRTVFESSDYKNDWDGGTLAVGTYFWIVKGSCIGSKRGILSILR